ncbi:Type II secretion system protein F [Pseudobythopirellula maris]|uniref:Type II secretion system protein F n=2 Tax=Pseudobythopirellula maris TaxID=2527991 RepID=A0A5C5ZHC1_9BACT|nr:Type II secretion system protein F [Pseudobythopirellula maris]
MPSKPLSELCHRLAVSIDAGIDIRRIWQREADSAHGRRGRAYAAIRDGVNEGDSLGVCLDRQSDLFPRLMREMVAVGEDTGALAEVLGRLSKHYDGLHRTRRLFLGQIAWPVLQLTAAAAIVGLLILIGGVLTDIHGKPLDLLGIGLTGSGGLIVYAFVLSTLAAIGALLGAAIARGALWTRSAQQLITRLPVVGPALKKIAQARLAWAMHLTLNVAMDVLKAAPLWLQATGNAYYTRHSDAVVASLREGATISEALAATDTLPIEMIDAIAVAEESGTICESMGRLSARYEEEAQSAILTLTRVAGGLVWLAMAAIMIAIIFRLFSFYTGMLYDALEGV